MSSRETRSLPSPEPGAPCAPRRRGSVLVLFALLFFVIMGFAALVIDIGIARLTQRQMQAASDGMALEVLRERDLARDPESTVDEYRRDHLRRQRNTRIASWHFSPRLRIGDIGDDEDVDETHGAGAYIDLRRGLTFVNAYQVILAAGFSMPRPRPNYHFAGEESIPFNLPYGDVVSGSYSGHLDPDGDGLPEGMTGSDGNPFNLEDTKYERVDFTPAEPEDCPFADAILARLRRTLRLEDTIGPNDAAGPDHSAGISSSGPRLPFFFGLGTTMHGGNPANGYSPRFHGMAVRATSIAQARSAVRIGVPRPEWEDPELGDGYEIGAAAFVIQKWLWNNEGNYPLLWTDEGGGNYSTLLTYNNGELKPATPGDDQPAGFLQPRRLYRVGDRIYRMTGPGADQFWNDWKNWVVEEAYVPIVRRDRPPGPWSDRVVGFVRARAERVVQTDPEGGPPIVFMKLWKLENESSPGKPWIAPRNASALFDGEQVSQDELDDDMFFGQTPWSWNILLRELSTLERAVAAPALVR